MRVIISLQLLTGNCTGLITNFTVYFTYSFRQKHNQLGIVCFTFSEKKKFKFFSFMHKTFVRYVGYMILQDFQLDCFGFQKIYL